MCCVAGCGIEQHVKRREMDTAVAMKEHMLAHGVKPSADVRRATNTEHCHRTRRPCDATLVLVVLVGLMTPPQSLGVLVHGFAKQQDLRSAFDTLDEMFKYDLKCPERHAFLLREKCKALGVWHPLVPAHPMKWQFSKRVTKHRKAVDARTRKGATELKAAAFMAS